MMSGLFYYALHIVFVSSTVSFLYMYFYFRFDIQVVVSRLLGEELLSIIRYARVREKYSLPKGEDRALS